MSFDFLQMLSCQRFDVLTYAFQQAFFLLHLLYLHVLQGFSRQLLFSWCCGAAYEQASHLLMWASLHEQLLLLHRVRKRKQRMPLPLLMILRSVRSCVLNLLPVLQESIKAAISQRMLNAFLQYVEWYRCDICTHERCLGYMISAAN